MTRSVSIQGFRSQGLCVPTSKAQVCANGVPPFLLPHLSLLACSPAVRAASRSSVGRNVFFLVGETSIPALPLRAGLDWRWSAWVCRAEQTLWAYRVSEAAQLQPFFQRTLCSTCVGLAQHVAVVAGLQTSTRQRHPRWTPNVLQRHQTAIAHLPPHARFLARLRLRKGRDRIGRFPIDCIGQSGSGKVSVWPADGMGRTACRGCIWARLGRWSACRASRRSGRRSRRSRGRCFAGWRRSLARQSDNVWRNDKDVLDMRPEMSLLGGIGSGARDRSCVRKRSSSWWKTASGRSTMMPGAPSATAASMETAHRHANSNARPPRPDSLPDPMRCYSACAPPSRPCCPRAGSRRSLAP
jgi:hypothetical protein